MAGTSSAFDAGTFRTIIATTMKMGMPPNVADQVTFKWNVDRTYTRPDQAGVPYDLSSTPTATVTKPPVVVPVAVQFQSGAADDTDLGAFDTTKAVLTILDVDYPKVADADFVVIGGHEYDIESTIVLGLFEVAVHQMHVHARSRT